MKLIKKINLLPIVNFRLKIIYDDKSVYIPIIKGIGYANLFLAPNWLTELTRHLLAIEYGAFIDVGVNVGQTLIAIKTIDKRINYIGFEPNVICCSYLNELIAINNYQKTDVYNLALNDKMQHLLLELNYETDSRASIVPQLRPNFFSKKQRILALTFDELQLKEKISIIKIDVEGAEYEVIKGMERAITDNQPFIFCEVLDIHSTEAEAFTREKVKSLCTMLSSLNYGIAQLEQSTNKGKIVNYVLLDEIDVKQWTKESSKFNDYIFYPLFKKESLELILQNLLHENV